MAVYGSDPQHTIGYDPTSVLAAYMNQQRADTGGGRGGGLPLPVGSSTPGVTSGLTSLPGTTVPVGTTAAATAGAGMDPITIAALISAGTSIAGGMMQGQGQANLDAANRRQQMEILARQQQLQRQQQGLASTQLDPLAQQKSRQQQAVMAAIMPQLRNVSVSSGVPGMDRFIPQVSGGLRLPEGGFDQSTLAFFSPQARAGAEAEFAGSRAPFVPADQQMPLSSMGYDPAMLQQMAAQLGPLNTTGFDGSAPTGPGSGSRTQTSDVAGRAMERNRAGTANPSMDAAYRNQALLKALR